MKARVFVRKPGGCGYFILYVLRMKYCFWKSMIKLAQFSHDLFWFWTFSVNLDSHICEGLLSQTHHWLTNELFVYVTKNIKFTLNIVYINHLKLVFPLHLGTTKIEKRNLYDPKFTTAAHIKHSQLHYNIFVRSQFKCVKNLNKQGI